MRTIIFTILITVYLFSFSAFSKECGVNVTFRTTPQITKDSHELAIGVNLYTQHYLSYQSKKGARIASSVNCQLIEGALYTGSNEEWQGIIQGNIHQLSIKGFEKLEFTAINGQSKNYDGALDNREYLLSAIKGEYVQKFYSIHFLNSAKDTLFTVMVSGDSSVKKEIEVEFKRLFASIKLPK